MNLAVDPGDNTNASPGEDKDVRVEVGDAGDMDANASTAIQAAGAEDPTNDSVYQGALGDQEILYDSDRRK